ncbi:MAG: esterase [Cocleimonas sp.]|jgi:esterase
MIMSEIKNTELLNYKTFPTEDHLTEDSATIEQAPLIILHGLLGSMDNWRGQAKRLSKNRTVITMDLRNHGNSPHIAGMSYREMYEDVLKLLIHLNIQSFDCLGHSMGGKVAMQLALANNDPNNTLNNPQTDIPVLNKLIIVDIAPRPYPLWHQQTLEAVMKAPVSELNSREAIDDYLQDSIEDATERGFMIKNLRRANENDDPSAGFRWKCNLSEIARGYLKIAGFSTAEQIFNKKTLFIGGGDSPYIREQEYSIINSLFPNSKIVTIENAGHLPHFQQADEFYERVDGFLR